MNTDYPYDLTIDQLKLLAVKRAICDHHNLDYEHCTMSVSTINPNSVTYRVSTPDKRTILIGKRTADQLTENWILETARLHITGNYPVTHMSRQDVRANNGIYIASRLSDDDIQQIADDWWPDTSTMHDMFYDAITWSLECLHPDLLTSPQAQFEHALKTKLEAINFYYFDTIPPDIVISFLDQLVQQHTTSSTSNSDSPQITPKMLRQFLGHLQTQDAIPQTFNITQGLDQINILEYQDSFKAYIQDIVNRGHPEAEYLFEIGIYWRNIQDRITQHFHNQVSIPDAFNNLLPTILSIVARTIDPDPHM